MQQINNLLNIDLSKFKVIYDQTLFPPNWEALKVNRCPLCSCLLKNTRNNKYAMCRSKKHKSPFLISLVKLQEYK